MIADRLGASDDSVWITFDSPQSRSLLAGKDARFVPYIPPRGWRQALRAWVLAARTTRFMSFDAAVSTGAGLAFAVLPQMRVRRIPTYYIESVSRINGPSLTGRMISATRAASLRTQHSSWADARWRPFPPVLGQFVAHHREPPGVDAAGDDTRRPTVFVTLGTIHPYRFDALIDGLLASGLVDERTVWQIGETSRSDLPGMVNQYMSADDFTLACANADVVVTHAGVGTILALLDAGVFPVVVPRRSARREHVDDHQGQISTLVEQLGVAAVTEANGDLASAILEASMKRVARSDDR
ncbi:glycosyltransferase [Microbacterium sp. CFBP 8790]|uniref:glycosyltransferase n=1 Tax=unclassified Microbacterium TaxID=2609290 RepID=UPI0017868F79|nr:MULTISPECIES: glycosyltransferase [unclassified Microbacterium]MBD8207666.1 glycosyltransferase [Microbacterium sp. CFBP 8801]MBD8508585.1 glycosyltransferase [Microbacterium sp. CFBP 8790]